MSINLLYPTLLARIRQLHPGERVTRVLNLAWLLLPTEGSLALLFDPYRLYSLSGEETDRPR